MASSVKILSLEVASATVLEGAVVAISVFRTFISREICLSEEDVKEFQN